jgi:hypothetical protein
MYLAPNGWARTNGDRNSFSLEEAAWLAEPFLERIYGWRKGWDLNPRYGFPYA